MKMDKKLSASGDPRYRLALRAHRRSPWSYNKLSVCSLANPEPPNYDHGIWIVRIGIEAVRQLQISLSFNTPNTQSAAVYARTPFHRDLGLKRDLLNMWLKQSAIAYAIQVIYAVANKNLFI